MIIRDRVISVVFVSVVVVMATLTAFVYAQNEEGYMKADGLYLPLGDPDQGREAFKALKCYSCHQVESDASLPKPTVKPAPVLARAGMVHNPGDFADAILSPSHQISIDSGGEKEGSLSRMGDFADTMTVRQLLDIIAYLMREEGW